MQRGRESGKRWGLLLLLAGLMHFAQPLHAADSFSLRYLSNESSMTDQDFTKILQEALAVVESQYLPFYAQSENLKLQLTVVLSENPRSITFSAKRPDEISDTVYLNWQDAGELPVLLPPLLFSLWANLHGLAAQWRGTAPVASAEVSLNSIAPMLGVPIAAYQAFGGIAPVNGSGVYITGTGLVAELGEDLSLRSLYRPDTANPYTYFYLASISSSGILQVVSATGESWLLRRGGEFERGPVIQPVPSRMAATPEGSLLYYDDQAKTFYKVSGRRRAPLAVSGQNFMTYPVFTYDEDNRLWVYDLVSGLAKMFSQDGQLQAAVRLIQRPDAPQGLYTLHVRGSELILSGQGGLVAWDYHGLPLWTISAPPPQADPVGTSVVNSVAVDRRSAIYLLLSSNNSLTRYDDQKSLQAADSVADSELFRQLTILNAAIRQDPDNEQYFVQRADLVQEAEVFSMEYTFRLAMEQIFPDNQRNTTRLKTMLQQVLRSNLLAEAEGVYQPLQRYGVATARMAFQTAMINFERYLADYPDDAELRQEMNALAAAFAAREAGTDSLQTPPLQLTARLEQIFPAFMERYRQVPAGVLTITNSGTQSLSGLSAQVMVKDFMDFPVLLPIGTALAAGASVDLPLRLLFNRNLLELNEAISAAVEIQLLASDGRIAAQARSEMRILARTALTWEDSAALAAFVTPNDETVLAFSHVALSQTALPLFGRNFSKAFALVTALGARGLTYVEDPRTPFSSAASGAMVDTVRFPRSTLLSGAGDCDDTTALLASCLEAAGVPIAIVTTPGHVLLAFQADSSPNGSGRYASALYGSMELDNRFWIPLETTVLSKGFAEAWRLGWQEVHKAGERFELIPLESAREFYPAIPLASSPSMPPLPVEAAVIRLAESAVHSLADHWLAPAEQAAAAVRGRTAAAAYNDLAIRQLQFGRRDQALSSLNKAVSADGTFATARVNLVTLLNNSGRKEEALDLLRQSLVLLPASRPLQALAASLGSDAAGAVRLADTPSQNGPAVSSGAGSTTIAETESAAKSGRATSAESGMELQWAVEE